MGPDVSTQQNTTAKVKGKTHQKLITSPYRKAILLFCPQCKLMIDTLKNKCKLIVYTPMKRRITFLEVLILKLR